MTVAKANEINLNVSYEAMTISSGKPFINETESQVILNGSCDIPFTMDLVAKNIGLFQAVVDRAEVPLELNPRLISILRNN